MGEGTGSGKGIIGDTEHAQIFTRTAEKTPLTWHILRLRRYQSVPSPRDTEESHRCLGDLSGCGGTRFGHMQLPQHCVTRVLNRCTQRALGGTVERLQLGDRKKRLLEDKGIGTF